MSFFAKCSSLWGIDEPLQKISCFTSKSGLKRDQIPKFCIFERNFAHRIFVFHPIMMWVFFCIEYAFSSMPTEFICLLWFLKSTWPNGIKECQFPKFKHFYSSSNFKVVFCKIFNLISFFFKSMKTITYLFHFGKETERDLNSEISQIWKICTIFIFHPCGFSLN